MISRYTWTNSRVHKENKPNRHKALIMFQNRLNKLDTYESEIISGIIIITQIKSIKFMEETKKSLFGHDTLQCIKSQHSIFICTSENCKQTAFMCNNESCDCINSKHYRCSSHGTKYLINSIEQQRKDIPEQSKRSFEAIIKIYEDMINKISVEKEEFMDFIDMFGLGQNMRKFVNLIRQGKLTEINGDLAHKVQLEINLEKKQSDAFSIDQRVVKIMWEKKKEEFSGIISKLSQFRDENKLKIASIVENSQIIQSDGFNKIKQFMPRQVNSFELLFRGSQNGFLAKKFHEKCDGVQDTLTIVQTQFGKIIGGYTPIKWQCPQSSGYKQDTSGESFLFSLSLNKKYKLTENATAVYHWKECGPRFGRGADLHISNSCQTGSNACTYFPTSYSNGQDKNDQQSWTAFSGQTSGSYFKVKQYEVFKVIWK